MQTYKPAEHAETSDVAPLVQFFELAHLGDTIQSMVQVYFDKTLVSWVRLCSKGISDNYQAFYIDITDFLNAAVREKKKFENSLDNSVAVGLNAGTELLMHQVHLYCSSYSYINGNLEGGTHCHYTHKGSGILSTGRCTTGAKANQWLYRSHPLFRKAL
jgi:hypothetical protein